LKNKAILLVLSILIVAALVLPSCNTSNTTPATSGTAQTTSVSQTGGNWWDTAGKPQYGGTMTLSIPNNITSFDPYMVGTYSIAASWMERLLGPNWKVDPKVFNYSGLYVPSDYVGGWLAQSWEFTDPNTFVIHLHQGIHWQNISPANGREFTADDVVWQYNHEFGLGGGFTKPSTAASSTTIFQNLTSLTDPDKYTVIFKWKSSDPEYVFEALDVTDSGQLIENPEAVAQWGDVTDWHHAIGTGPFILSDFVSGSSATLVKNPNYWGTDEHYPQNKLPYIDTLKYLIIPDATTALAALRTGTVDAMDNVTLQQAQDIEKTNPKLVKTSYPTSNVPTLDPRVDKAPFSDSRVRWAMQEAIDLPTIAKTYYAGTCSADPLTLTSYAMTGWGYPYDQWPQDLKDKYAYNPTAAKQLLADAGYPNGFDTEIVVQNTVDLSLLQIVKSYYSAVGINMNINVMDPTEWMGYVFAHKQTQMAEFLLGGLGLNYAFFFQLQRYQTGFVVNIPNVSDTAFDAFYTQAMAATSTDQVKQIVRDANKYVAEQHWAISLLQFNLFTFNQPWLKGYGGQTFTIGGGNIGPQFSGYFLSRFWIDQKTKSANGH
jgi:peptide/nickel transport system substrate-binding protein